MTGTAILSVEIELAWGYHELSRADKYDMLSPTRTPETETLDYLLGLCEQFEIPISFDVVGHLLLDECRGTHEGAFPLDWFTDDPGTTTDADPLFYAPDLVDRIRASPVDHEICTHTFSHALGAAFSASQLATDLEIAQQLHRDRLGTEARSLVPPRHQSMDHAVLSEHGISVIRKSHGQVSNHSIRQLYRFFARRHPVVEPRRMDGLVTTYTSPIQSLTTPTIPYGQRSPHPLLRWVPLGVRKRVHDRYISNALDRAITAQSHAHFWTHLHDMANDPQRDVVRRSLARIAHYRDDAKLRIARMADLA